MLHPPAASCPQERAFGGSPRTPRAAEKPGDRGWALAPGPPQSREGTVELRQPAWGQRGATAPFRRDAGLRTITTGGPVWGARAPRAPSFRTPFRALAASCASRFRVFFGVKYVAASTDRLASCGTKTQNRKRAATTGPERCLCVRECA